MEIADKINGRVYRHGDLIEATFDGRRQSTIVNVRVRRNTDWQTGELYTYRKAYAEFDYGDGKIDIPLTDRAVSDIRRVIRSMRRPRDGSSSAASASS